MEIAFILLILDLSRYKDKELSKRQLQNVRNKVSTQLETMIEELLITRKEERGIGSLVRSVFTR